MHYAVQFSAEMYIFHKWLLMFLPFPLQVSAALAGNLGDNIDATAISALGSESTGLSNGQINMIKPEDLFAALGTLSSVNGWNGGQAKAIIRSLMGIMKVSAVFLLLHDLLNSDLIQVIKPSHLSFVPPDQQHVIVVNAGLSCCGCSRGRVQQHQRLPADYCIPKFCLPGTHNEGSADRPGDFCCSGMMASFFHCDITVV